MRSLPAVFLLAAALVSAGSRTPEGQAGDSTQLVDAKVYTDRAAIKELLGSDLDGNFVIVEVKVEPKRKLDVRRDNFMLRTDRDGERSSPFTGSQIAGRGALVIKPVGSAGSAVMGQERGPVYGGVDGSRPRQMGGCGGGIGNTASIATGQSATYSDGSKKEDPLRAVLDKKILPEKETADPVEGLLYFPMEPKQKSKQLELVVTTPKGKLFVRFK